MMPTVQDGQKDRGDSSGRGVVKSDFVCMVKYNNTLPDIPFDAKFITYPFEANRFTQYKPTTLERNYKHDLLTEPDLGVTIDLINPDTYAFDPNAVLDPADERLLEEEIVPAADQKRQKQHSRSVSWLRKTEYISTEFNRFQTSNDMVETKVGYSMKKKLQGMDLYKDREAQLQAIEGSFEAAKKPITTHHSNPRLKPVEILPVFPDFQFWGMPCAHVIFDTEPTPRGKTESATMDEMSFAMIRGMEDESGDQFVAYFLPTEETLRKRKREEETGEEGLSEDENEYKLAREYNWNVKNKASKGYEENYFFVFREEGVFYDELQTRVRLNKRRVKGGAGGVTSSVSKLLVRSREPTEDELRMQQAKLAQLENVVQEEEEEDDEAEEGDDEQGEAADERNSEASEGEENQQDIEEEGEKDEEETQENGETEKEDDAEDKNVSDLDNELFGSSSSEGED